MTDEEIFELYHRLLLDKKYSPQIGHVGDICYHFSDIGPRWLTKKELKLCQMYNQIMELFKLKQEYQELIANPKENEFLSNDNTGLGYSISVNRDKVLIYNINKSGDSIRYTDTVNLSKAKAREMAQYILEHLDKENDQ